MFDEEHDLSPAAIAPWWDDFEHAFWKRRCLSKDQIEYDEAWALGRDRARLRYVAADFTDLDPELAVIKLFKKGLTA
jgi:hypothetical protein